MRLLAELFWLLFKEVYLSGAEGIKIIAEDEDCVWKFVNLWWWDGVNWKFENIFFYRYKNCAECVQKFVFTSTVKKFESQKPLSQDS